MFTLKNVKYKNIIDIHNLNIDNKELTCIVGSSGSGKSTLLRLLNKMISCDSGNIFYKGFNIDDIDTITLRRKVIMVPQTPIIFDGNIKHNLLIGLKFSDKQEEHDDKLYSVLKIVHLNKNLNDDCCTLSGGEQQRLCIARAILIEPEVFLLDEPTSALDKNTESIIMKNLIDYAKQNNKTLILVTHSKNIANNYADSIITISNGQISECKEV